VKITANEPIKQDRCHS